MKKRPAGSLPPSKPPPARHRPDARSARRPRCSPHYTADRGTRLMLTNHRLRPTPPRRFRPRLEVLEDRALPSTFTVLNLADSGAGSLRAAILAANSPAH